MLFLGSSGAGRSVSPSIPRKSISASPAHVRDRDVVRTSLERALGAFADSPQRGVHPGNQHAEGDDQPDHVPLDDPFDAFVESVEFPEQAEGKQEAEQIDEKGVDGRELPGVREILDPLASALLEEKVSDRLVHVDELRHDDHLAGEKPFHRPALKSQDLGRLAAGGQDLRQLRIRKVSRQLRFQRRLQFRDGVVPQNTPRCAPCSCFPMAGALAADSATRSTRRGGDRPAPVTFRHRRMKSRLMVPQARLLLMMSPHICRASQVRL